MANDAQPTPDCDQTKPGLGECFDRYAPNPNTFGVTGVPDIRKTIAPIPQPEQNFDGMGEQNVKHDNGTSIAVDTQIVGVGAQMNVSTGIAYTLTTAGIDKVPDITQIEVK